MVHLASEEHKQFMYVYGVLIRGIRLKNIGPLLTTLTPLLTGLAKLW